MEGKIIGISGSVVTVSGLEDPKMNNIVFIGGNELVGEIVKIEGENAIIQVYEDTSGLRIGEKAVDSNEPLSVELGPGLIGSIFDGIQRPLDKILDKEGTFISSGVKVNSLDREKKWHFKPKVEEGKIVEPGEEIGEVKETSLIKHKVLVPANKKGVIKKIAEEGDYTIEENIAILEDNNKTEEIKLMTRWPVRTARPVKEKLSPNIPLLTGQRVIDTMFPVAMGGTAAVPGPFGSGKTVIQHQLAKWSDADVIVYVGCGERGNEMTEILATFPELKDPKSGKPLMDRTILIANTSNMPVAAREASIYTGITLAEYYRDMGYSVAVMADSTSRWAEALRELSGRLEEMPGEEGYPAYLGRRVGEFYERAGRARILSGKIGAATIIGAVSPPGGDISEPVSQNTLRVTRVFWALDASLANARHFPSINWLNSYSLYTDGLNQWYRKNIAEDWPELRNKSLATLQKEAEINEIVQLVGYDALPESDKLILDVAKMLREDYLQQNAFDDIDTYASVNKQYKMLKLINQVFDAEKAALDRNVPIEKIQSVQIKPKIARLRYTSEEELDGKLKEIEKDIEEIKKINAEK
ncbi:MAG: H+transporting two-sector ATPase alpha/beta subunit central region [Candidatus Parvarchaeum acidiphilum ARMAN-4]|jgi:V/A-type H+-transporting ATPase subunit A|uniref:A-type ATP synthase subunit A n=1 Tax=Candidatus Parvarchaeum acidiphilum ARMAN-4 TaxID=662760 RepID=D2EEE7_PARA4|nr:MAG: H+transporting two-sector ATPase alpha/beta subunit central region [Candidatus Parvarchaeum acidiphilum ARMAN-4]